MAEKAQILIVEDEKQIARFLQMELEHEGYECGIGLEKFTDIKVGDIYETYIIEEYRD